VLRVRALLIVLVSLSVSVRLSVRVCPKKCIVYFDLSAVCRYTCCGACATCQDAREFRIREEEIVSNAYAVQQAQAAPAQAAMAPVQAEK
jgi:hypothetical protein